MLKCGENIVLIGMPAVGKSTIGVLLAKAISMDFIDTDVYIQSQHGRGLQEIIDEDGLHEFCRIEESYISNLNCRNTIIATGGSVVYSEKSVGHLKSSGVLIHLDLSLAGIKKRLTNLDSRGVAMGKGQTLEQLFEDRQPLYTCYRDVWIQCKDKTQEQIVAEIIEKLG